MRAELADRERSLARSVWLKKHATDFPTRFLLAERCGL